MSGKTKSSPQLTCDSPVSECSAEWGVQEACGHIYLVPSPPLSLAVRESKAVLRAELP